MAIAIYARKSVERENSISCETQVEYCKAAIKPDEREETVLTFIDNGFSGGNMDREGFQTMMKMIRQGKIRKVLVYKLDRISRSLSDFVNILQEFKGHQVEFVSSQEAFDTASVYGELIVKILMVFAEFERTSIINRVTQAYHHRSEMGFYMGGRQPYGFTLVQTVIHNIQTKKLEPVPAEADQIRYIFEAYGQRSISLRKLQELLISEGQHPLNGSQWTTAKLSTLLRNPIYVKADGEIYDYYQDHGVQMITDSSAFCGTYGAQLYGHSKHRWDDPDWSDMRLVLLSHEGIVPSHIWLKCQRKLEKNRQFTSSCSNPTSWLAGKVICETCGHTMTTIKGSRTKRGEVRRYFICTGKSHRKLCPGPKDSVYAEDLENMVYACITEKLSFWNGVSQLPQDCDARKEVADLKLKIKAVERTEQKLMDEILTGGFREDLLALANRKAAQLKQERQTLRKRLESKMSRGGDGKTAYDLVAAWRQSDYQRKKSVAVTMIHQILIRRDGSVNVIWKL